MQIALDADVCFSPFFLFLCKLLFVAGEGVGTNKFAESTNHGISFYLRLGVWGTRRTPEAVV